MTPDELDRLADEATPGPWRVHHDEDHDGIYKFESLTIGMTDVYGLDEPTARLIALTPQLARDHAALLRLASDPQVIRDLLWMAEGRKMRDRKATDDLLAALDAMGGHQ